MKSNTNLWRSAEYPDRRTENVLRAGRVWDYLITHGMQATYKQIRGDLGLSYWQTVRAVGLLINGKYVEVTIKPIWNGMYYIYPHVVRIP